MTSKLHRRIIVMLEAVEWRTQRLIFWSYIYSVLTGRQNRIVIEQKPPGSD
jgi:hypothetical protein